MASPMYPVPCDSDNPGAMDVKWFAGLAMQAIIAKQSSAPDTKAEREEIALWAYRMGQVMADMEKQLHADE